jgi:sarcosine oxidase
LFVPDRFPVFNLLVDEGRYYGFPVFGVPGFKVGLYHHLEETVDPDEMDRECYPRDEDLLREFTERYFPDAAGPTMTLKACMFTNTRDNHFIIDFYPGYPQVSFSAGFSGHGFKFASVIGEILADLAERGMSRHNIELFRLDRFTGRSGVDERQRLTSPHQLPRRTRPGIARRFASQSRGETWDDSQVSTIAEEEKGAIKPFW